MKPSMKRERDEEDKDEENKRQKVTHAPLEAFDEDEEMPLEPNEPVCSLFGPTPEPPQRLTHQQLVYSDSSSDDENSSASQLIEEYRILLPFFANASEDRAADPSSFIGDVMVNGVPKIGCTACQRPFRSALVEDHVKRHHSSTVQMCSAGTSSHPEPVISNTEEAMMTHMRHHHRERLMIDGQESFKEVDLLARGYRPIIVDLNELNVPIVMLTRNMGRLEMWKKVLVSKHRLNAQQKLKIGSQTSIDYWVNLRQFNEEEQRQLVSDMDDMQLKLAELNLEENESDESL